MGRRWWIASGVLIGVLALISFVLTRATGPTVTETAQVFTGVDYGPSAWAPGPAAVLGGLLVVAGLLVAVASLAYALGRRHAGAVTGVEAEAPEEAEAAADLSADGPSESIGPLRGRRSWALPAALSLALALVAGGLVLMVTDPSSGYTLTNGTKGIVPLDNVAAIPSGATISSQGFAVQVGVIPDVSGLPFAVARMVIQNAGFADVELADLDGDGLPDADDPGRVVDTVSPSPGTSPGTGVQVVVYLR